MIGRMLQNRAYPTFALPRTWWLILALEAGLLLTPLLITEFPPICDLINHEARLFILAGSADSLPLQRFYAPDWHLVPNLAMDVLGLALLRLMSLSVAGRVLLALNLLLCLGGTIAYHRVLFRTRSYWPLAVGLVLYGGAFLMGFINFVLSTGLALLAAAAFLSPHPGLSKWRPLVSAGFVLLLFVFHIFGLIFYLVLIGSHEAATIAWARLRQRPVATLLPPLRSLAVPVLVTAMLVVLSRHPSGALHIFWPSRMQRLTFAVSPFVSYDRNLFAATLLLFGVVMAALAAGRALLIPRSTAIALTALAVLYAVSPFSVANGNYIGLRFATFIALLLFAGIDVSPRRAHLAAGAGLLLATLLVVRIAQVDLVWARSRQDIADMQRAGATLPPGSTVLVLEARPDENRALYYREQPQSRELPGVYSTFIYLPALWTIERQIFFPLIFTIPTLQPLQVTPQYRKLAVPFGVPPDYRLLFDPVIRRQEASYAPYTADWQKDFDYVAILSSGRARHLDQIDAAPIRLISQSDVVNLYKVVR